MIHSSLSTLLLFLVSFMITRFFLSLTSTLTTTFTIFILMEKIINLFRESGELVVGVLSFLLMLLRDSYFR